MLVRDFYKTKNYTSSGCKVITFVYEDGSFCNISKIPKEELDEYIVKNIKKLKTKKGFSKQFVLTIKPR